LLFLLAQPRQLKCHHQRTAANSRGAAASEPCPLFLDVLRTPRVTLCPSPMAAPSPYEQARPAAITYGQGDKLRHLRVTTSIFPRGCPRCSGGTPRPGGGSDDFERIRHDRPRDDGHNGALSTRPRGPRITPLHLRIIADACAGPLGTLGSSTAIVTTRDTRHTGHTTAPFQATDVLLIHTSGYHATWHS
jgi:hypothetical protein